MQRTQTKVRPTPARRQTPPRRPALLGLAWLTFSLLLLGSCQRKLNQRDGRYYSARDMVRLKRGERVGGNRPAVVKQKTKIRPGRPVAAPDATAVAPSTGAKAARKYVVRPSSAQGVVAVAIEAARSYQGTPYLFGGTTRAGLDCSALLQLSFAEAGVDIPRSSNEQAAWGDPIKPTELRPGDFLFFGATPGSSTITHVGLVTVVDADGVEFIHASSSLGVIENAFESDYYLSRFIRAIRPRL